MIKKQVNTRIIVKPPKVKHGRQVHGKSTLGGFIFLITVRK